MKYNILIGAYLYAYITSVMSSFCYWNAGCPYKYFSSKTSYNSVRGDIRDSNVKLKDCEPVSIWGTFRHGKIYPGVDSGKNMKEAIILRDYVVSSYEKGKSSLCAQDIENLRNWPVDSNLFEKAHFLTDEGYQEMVGIGERMKQSFSKLLANLEKGNYLFRPAPGHWIRDSANGFINGLGGKHLNIEEVKDDYYIMAPYATCERYKKEISNQSELSIETTKYLETSDYLAAKDRIQRRTGIEYILKNEHITSLYDLCRYVWSGVDNKISPWCALFTTDDLKVLEYVGDLRHYYRSSYGMSMSEAFGQILLADLLKNFQLAKDGMGNKITAYFTNDTMLDMVYTALGLFKDEAPLTGASRHRERKWRSSKLSSFSANIFAVLNRCTKGGSKEYNVVFYLNEEPLRYICENGVCSWQEFEEKLKPFVNTTIDFCDSKTNPDK